MSIIGELYEAAEIASMCKAKNFYDAMKARGAPEEYLRGLEDMYDIFRGEKPSKLNGSYEEYLKNREEWHGRRNDNQEI